MTEFSHPKLPEEAPSFTPKSPEILRHEAVEAIRHGGREILSLGRANLPLGIHNLEGLQIDGSMPLDERLRIVNENVAIFHEAVSEALQGVEPKILKKHIIYWDPQNEATVVPDGKIFDWKDHGVPTRTVYYRLGPHIALMDNYRIDEKGNPVKIKPQLWFSEDMINGVLKDRAPKLLPETAVQTVAFRRAA